MSESDDRERSALQALASRRAALMTRVLLVFLIAGAALGVVGYFVVRDAQFAATFDGASAVSFPLISSLGFVVPLLVMGALGRAVATALLRARMPVWVDAVAREHGIERTVLEETTDLLAELG